MKFSDIWLVSPVSTRSPGFRNATFVGRWNYKCRLAERETEKERERERERMPTALWGSFLAVDGQFGSPKFDSRDESSRVRENLSIERESVTTDWTIALGSSPICTYRILESSSVSKFRFTTYEYHSGVNMFDLYHAQFYFIDILFTCFILFIYIVVTLFISCYSFCIRLHKK